MSDDTFRLVITAGVLLAALCTLAQAIAMVGLLRTMKKMKEKVDPLAEKAGPGIEMIRSSSAEVIPRVMQISDNAVEISRSAREQVNRVGSRILPACMAPQD